MSAEVDQAAQTERPYPGRHAWEGLHAAWQRVRENRGCAGVDGVTIEDFTSGLPYELSRLHGELADGRYRPLPLLQILVDKGNGEARALCIPTVRDRVAQAAALEQIEPILEPQFEECSFAFRKGRSVRQAVHRIKELYEQGYRWVVDADIDAFFDSIDHDLLLAKVDHFIHDESLRWLLRLWVRAEVWDGKAVTPLERGIPQGSVVSPILANLFLDDLDEELHRRGLKLVRYADDFIILSKERVQAEAALEITAKILDLLRLDLDEEKTTIVSFDHGFKYLGVLFVRSLIMVPFEKPDRVRRVLYMPPPLDVAAYRRTRDRRP
jgi:group II intron reverse transcriptase/maturase